MRIRAILLGCLLVSGCARDASLCSPAEPVLPLVSEKRVIAHYMTSMLYFDGGESEPTYDLRSHYRLDGPSGAIGGFNQAFPIMDFRGPGKSMDEAAEFELRAAKTLGIDGFQFYYPLRASEKQLKDWTRIIEAFFRVAERTGINFKLTLCLSLADAPLTEAQKIEKWGRGWKKLLAHREWDDIWLKTPDGRIITYLWSGAGFSDRVSGAPALIENPALVAADAEAYERLAAACGIRAAYIYHMRWWMLKNADVVDQLLGFYPAFWSFLPMNSRFGAEWDAFADQCAVHGRAYSETICEDFYTSKLYRKEGKQFARISKLSDALELGVDGMWRRVFVSDLSGELRSSMERAMRVDSPLLSVSTWNDYPEGHQICPDVNKNFSFATLLQYFSNIWKGTPERNVRDIGWVFYKKYPSNVHPSLADFEIRHVEEVPLSKEDFIEAVVALQSPAQVFLNGKDLGELQAGLSIRRIPIEAGPVRLKAVRGDKVVFEFTAPQWITDHPYRTDRATVGYSSEYAALWRKIFGDKIPVSACEYAEDEKGVPNWKRNVFLTDEVPMSGK